MPKPPRAALSLLLASAIAPSLPFAAGAATPLKPSSEVSRPAANAPRPDVVRVDIDGDKRIDTIRIVPLTRTGWSDKFRIEVTTANRKRSSLTYEQDGHTYGKPMLFAAVAMDGEPGAELIMNDHTGPHTWWYRVFTWRKGRLVSVNSPMTREPKWWNDGQAASWYFYTLRGVRYAERREVSPPRPGNRIYSGSKTTFRWKSGSWQRMSSKPYRIHTEKDLRLSIGWRGLGTKAE